MLVDVKSVFSRVRAALRHRGASSCDADDLVQEAWLRFSRYQGIRDVENPEGLLMRIAINLSIDAHRHRGGGELVAEDTSLVVDLAPGADVALQAKEQLARLTLCVERLPERTREIFLAYRLDGRTYADIAAELGLAVSVVEKHVTKAAGLITAWMEGW